MPKAMSFYSRYSTGHFIYPTPFSKQNEFVACLISNIKDLKIDVLIPVYEELFLVAKHKQELAQHVKMAVPDYSQILTVHNKDRWKPVAQGLNIPVPNTFQLDKVLSNKSQMAQLAFPVLIKPAQGGGGWALRQADSAKELFEIAAQGSYQELPLSRFIVQEKINGDTICVAMVLSNGCLRGKVAYRQIREYPYLHGQATCRISISNKTAEDNLQRLLQHLNWHGVCQADFVVDKETQVPYLIDINPRFWGSLVQAIASGVDFPYLVSQIALNGDVEVVQGFQEGVTTRWLGGELRGFFQHYANAGHKLQFLRDFFFPKIPAALYDDFSLTDPFPFAFWSVDSLYRVLKYKKLQPHDSLQGIWS